MRFNSSLDPVNGLNDLTVTEVLGLGRCLSLVHVSTYGSELWIMDFVGLHEILRGFKSSSKPVFQM